MSESPQLSRELFERLLKRERDSRKEAERLLDQKSIEIYDTNVRLRALADELESRVERRTTELEAERNRAVAAAEALRKSESRFTDVANIVGEYLWELDANYCFTSVTGQVENVLGYKGGDLIGRSILDYMPEEDASQMLSAFKVTETDGEVFTNHAHRARALNGSVVWQRSSGAPNFDANGRVSGFRGASLDVSEQERSKEQMQQLMIALQHASEAIVMTNEEDAVLFANDACAKMFAYSSREELIGRPWQQFYPPIEARRFEIAIASKLRAGEGFSGEGTGLREDGTEFPGHFSFNRLPNGELLWICRDESERLSTLMNLQTQNSLLSALLENIRIGVLFEDASGQQDLLHNITIVRILGIERAACDGLRKVGPLFEQLRQRCRSESSEALLEQLIDLEEDASNLQLEIDEDTCLVVDRIPVYVGTTYRGALWAVRDISEEKRQALDMEEARQRAEAGDQAKSSFLANMSHEIRTPLNGICGMARILMGTSLEHDAFEQVRAIQTSADSLLHVLNDILDFSKVEAGQLDIEIVNFDLAQVLDSAFMVLHARAMEKQLRFDFIYPDARIPMLRGDPSRLNEVLLNLIGNAIKFTSTGGITVNGRVVSQDEESLRLQLSIRDTGIGMNAEDLERVFEPFIQADSSISRRFGGTGLGLSICRDLIQLMKGTLSVESEQEGGTEFVVDLPYALGDQVLGCSGENTLNRPVFIVTASDDFFGVVKTMLAYTGERLVRVRDAVEALTHLESRQWTRALLLLDRSQQRGYAPGEDEDLLYPIPKGVRRILISDVAPPGSVKNAYLIAYPFSRYKFLSTVYTQLDLRMPQELFQEFGSHSYDAVDLSGLRVLLAEDNTINQKVARITIERFGAAVDVVANGLEVLAIVERFEYDLILMDIRMPEMDGVEACSRIRSRGLTLPIYALTADAMKGDRERFMQAGMNGYLSKPLVEADLVNVLLSNHEAKAVNEETAVGDDSDESVSDAAEVSPADELWAEASESVCLDFPGFCGLLGGQEALAHSLLLQFVDYAVDCAQEGVDSLKAGDLDVARGCFHKLAGSASTICARQVRAYFLSLERSLVQDPPDQDSCLVRVPECMDALHRLCAEIRTVSGGEQP